MNAITAAILAEWHAGIHELADNSEVKALVLTGAGKAFSAGLGLSWFLPRFIGLPHAIDMPLNVSLLNCLDRCTPGCRAHNADVGFLH